MATAFADGDWDTARQISPLPEWDDRTYEEGFAGLEASTVVVGGTDDSNPDRLVMYLMQVAHESRQEGPQTSAYCVRWDLLLESMTIHRVAGELLNREAGFVPASEMERGAFACNEFDTHDDPPAPDPAPPQPPSRPSGAADSRVLVSYGNSDYVCQPTLLGYGDYDCERYFGGEWPTFFISPDLRCSTTGLGLECTTDNYYPSDLDGYELGEIGYERVLCRWGDCWIWHSWESPDSATIGRPDYECSGSTCLPT